MLRISGEEVDSFEEAAEKQREGERGPGHANKVNWSHRLKQ